MREDDWSAVQEIYREGIATGHATFESEAPDWDQFDTSRLPRHRLVAGRRNRIARMTHGPLTGQWRDTVLIERRSPAT
ncbi:MAG: phosphinothricin acetyltransferase [Arthrobacter sp.]|nr:phosphinothricin acetyltransferase [Arthrobacter sp.]